MVELVLEKIDKVNGDKMSNFDNANINSIWQLIIFLIIPFLLFFLLTKLITTTTTIYQEKINSRKNQLETKIISEKFKIILIQFTLIILSQNIAFILPINIFQIHYNFLVFHLLPILTTTTFLQLFICFSFLSKNQKKIKLWNNIRAWLFIILIFTTVFQFLTISWQLNYLLFKNPINFILISVIYLMALFCVYRMFSRHFLIIKFLIANTYKILIYKTNNNINTYHEEILKTYSKRKLISSLWSFNNLKQINNCKKVNKKIKTSKIIKETITMFLISCRNLLLQNTIKEQEIIINGYKISLKQ